MKRAATNTWYSQSMASGRSQMTATGNVGDLDAIIGEIRWWLNVDEIVLEGCDVRPARTD